VGGAFKHFNMRSSVVFVADQLPPW